MRLRRLMRFRLRTLLILMAAVAFLIFSIRRTFDQYHVEQDALGQLREYRFPVTVKVQRSWWVPDSIDHRFARVFDRVVQLTIAGNSMDWERGISLDSRNFGDRHLHLLSRFQDLERLDLSMTQIDAESVDTLARLPALKALDLNGTHVGDAGIREFKRRRPDCLVCDSQPAIFAHLRSDDTISIAGERGRLEDAAKFLLDARRGPDAFGYAPMLYIFADDTLVRRRAQMIRQVRAAAIDTGYQSVQITGL